MHSNIWVSMSVQRDTVDLELSLDIVFEAAGPRTSALLNQMQEVWILAFFQKHSRVSVATHDSKLHVDSAWPDVAGCRVSSQESQDICKSPTKISKPPPLCTTTTRNTAQRMQKKRDTLSDRLELSTSR